MMTDSETLRLIQHTARRIMHDRGGYTWEFFIPAAMWQLNLCGGMGCYEYLSDVPTIYADPKVTEAEGD